MIISFLFFFLILQFSKQKQYLYYLQYNIIIHYLHYITVLPFSYSVIQRHYLTRQSYATILQYKNMLQYLYTTHFILFLAIQSEQATHLTKLQLFRNANGLKHGLQAACENNSKVFLCYFIPCEKKH